MVGNGWTEPLRQQTVRLGVRDRVRFSGFIPDSELNLLYRVADVAVYPSLYEPFGIVALEAMATRTPVVTSDVGGFRETITHGETGLHTWANNPESLAWGIVEVLEHPATGKSWAKICTESTGPRQVGRGQGRMSAPWVEQYSWDHLAARTVDIYREVLG
jgi:glycosyltransferase involved in cell wall biosynthesis